ncbi:helix-turn-helix domain-containing protein [Aeromicrobium ponti]|uniref:Tetratricopeptide repeat protein n=1 Tax=Cytobacillus oceanisediminis TaxID=665099 RepID=A0A562K2S0_9BACI|nr:helix-turn-helix domain-containing protein [Cytobacillus oceanisediminis]TWH89718.1 tetratricopeptide repeat protein [Cytobacillus oceanisediminis]
MNFSAIGDKIKELRKLMGLSQSELAHGICTQAQISKIEKGDVFPYASTLYLISQRLGVDVNYFFDIGTTPRIDYVQEVSRQLKLARRNLEYEEIYQIVKTEEKNALFLQNRKNLQLLLWHKGIYEYHLNKNVSKAFKLLDDAIQLTHDKVWSEREIEISLSKGIILFEEENLDDALSIYEPAKEQLKLLPYLQDDTIKSRLYYNLARTLTRLGKLDQSIRYCKQAIDYCIERDNLYLLGELHYHVGYNYELKKQIQIAKSYMEKALIIFELQMDEKYIQFIKKKISTWDVKN